MKAFVRHTGIAAPLIRENVDTDLIMPLNRRRSGLSGGQMVFDSIRYLSDGSTNPDFILNQDPYHIASILLTGRNFGTGSSRESAVTGLMDFGFQCVIAPSFGEIFYSNCFGNGMLPIILSEDIIMALTELTKLSPSTEFTIDLELSRISHPGLSESIGFQVDSRLRRKLLLGLDDIDEILSYRENEMDFQRTDEIARPWIYHWQT